MIRQIILLMIILLQSCDMKKNEIIEPRAEKINKIMTIHNHERIDEFYWLNERDNPKVIDYLNSENDYRNSYMEDYKGLENELFEDMVLSIISKSVIRRYSRLEILLIKTLAFESI